MSGRRVIDRLVIGLFLAGVTLPLLWVHEPDTAAEKRLPAPPPDWKPSRNFPAQFEPYFRDRFGLREPLVRLHNWFKYHVLSQAPNGNVTVGKDGWLFLESLDNTANFMGRRPLTENDLEAWRRALERRRDALARRGIPYLFVVVPDKQTVCPEYLPDALNRPGRSRLDQLLAYLAAHSDLEVLDLRPALRRAKAGGEVYCRLDSHWCDRGAHAGYTAIVERLARWFPGQRPWPLSDFTPVPWPVTGGDLTQVTGLPSPVVRPAELLVPRRPRRAHPGPVPPLPASPHRFMGDPHTAHVTLCDDPSLPRAVVLGDSFHMALWPFLSEHFSFACYLWQPTVQFPIVDQLKPDVVIQEMCERFLFGTPTCDDSEEYEAE